KRAARPMRRRLEKMRNEVLIVGYAPQTLGGVTTVTNTLKENIPYLKLHAALRWHRPRWKAVGFLLVSFATFLLRLVLSAPRVVQVVIGSRGDSARTLPYIALAKLRGCAVCLHFHTSRDAIFGQRPDALGRIAMAIWKRADAYCFLSDRLR